jgi:hypothetical protein
MLTGKIGAGNEIRTRDLNLGKVALYQLSYSRKCCRKLLPDNGSELYGSFLERQQPDEKISVNTVEDEVFLVSRREF